MYVPNPLLHVGLVNGIMTLVIPAPGKTWGHVHREEVGAVVRPYEIMLVLQPDLEEEATDALLERLTGVVTSEGGSIENLDRWGKRRLAYEIKGFTEGFYVVMDFQAEPATASELERIVKLTDGVIRHLLIRRDN